MSEPDRHYVSVLWGSDPVANETAPKVYGFDTDREVDAFVLGIEEASGWLENRHILHPAGDRYLPEDFDLDLSLEDLEEDHRAEWRRYQADRLEQESTIAGHIVSLHPGNNR